MGNMMILVANAAVWIYTFLYWWRKKGLFNTGVVALALYTTMAIVAVPLFFNPMARFDFEQDVTVFPFVYLYVMLMLMLYPLLKIEEHKIEYIQLPPVKYFNAFGVFIIISSVYVFYELIPDISKGLFMLMSDSSYGKEAYSLTTEANMGAKSMTGGGLDVLSIIANFGLLMSMPYTFIYMLLPKKKTWIMVGLLLTLIIPSLTSLSSGSREVVIVTVLLFLLLFVFFHKFMNKSLIKKIVVGSSILIFCFFIFFTAISSSREDGDKAVQIYKYERYFGESFLIFNQKCLDADGTREGAWVSAFFSVLMGNPNYSQEELRFKYMRMGIDNSRFYTHVGDFVLDYGPLLAFIIYVFSSLFFVKKLHLRKIIYLDQMVLLYILIQFNSGFYLHQYTGVSGNIELIESIVIYLALRIFLRKNKNAFYIKLN